MRPIKLKMSAFGSYAKTAEVDFDKLGKSGLYLITGITGAGKTTIFDAITYALYGEASGVNREANMFRSDLADLDTPTEVELTFEYGGKEYFIKRNPVYERKKNKGKGTKNQEASAQLIYPDGTVKTSIKEVNNAVIEIMGIDKNQFSQIAMIAQGDFLKLLLASTDERKKIFQKLFHTENYQTLQIVLGNKNSELKNALNSTKSSIKQYVDGITCDENNSLEGKLIEAKEEKIPMEEIVDLIEKIIESDKEAEAKVQKDYETVESDIDKTYIELQTAQKQEAQEKKLKETEEKLSAENENLKNLEQAKKEADDRKLEAEKYSEKASKIKAELSEYEERDEIKAKLFEIEKNIDELNKKNSENEENKNIKEAELKKLEDENKSLENAGVDKAKYEAEETNLSGQFSEINNIKSEIEDISNKKIELNDAQDDYKKKSQNAIEKKADYDEKHRAFLDEQAGIIAETLQEGQPCPVCGSTSHPQLAKKSLKAPSQKELEDAKHIFEQADQELVQASKKASSLIATIDSKKENATKMAGKIIVVSDFESIKTQLQQKEIEVHAKLDKVKQKLKDIETKVARREALNKEIPELNKTIDEIKAEVEKYKIALQGFEKDKENNKQRIEVLDKKLGFNSKAEAENEIKNLEDKKSEIEKAIENARKELEDCNNTIAGLNGEITQLKEHLKDKKIIDVEKTNEELNKLIKERTRLLNENKVIAARVQNNENTLTNIKNKIAAQRDIAKKYELVQSLYNTASGQISGNEKIMLETFVQMTYFERIISRANKRLMIMSDNTYELVRAKDARNKSSQSGLDLNVHNHINGSIRDVKTLSGGESFLASLALALGLSDEIQASAGGIKLDSMFVDEGFGSLDEETLQQVMKALNGLTEGNRIVGIISHVKDLEQQIDKQIVVSKSKMGGSTLELIV